MNNLYLYYLNKYVNNLLNYLDACLKSTKYLYLYNRDYREKKHKNNKYYTYYTKNNKIRIDKKNRKTNNRNCRYYKDYSKHNRL